MSSFPLYRDGPNDLPPSIPEQDESHLDMSVDSSLSTHHLDNSSSSEDTFMDSWCSQQQDSPGAAQDDQFSLWMVKRAPCSTPVTTQTPRRALYDRSRSADQIPSNASRKRRDHSGLGGSSGKKYLRCSASDLPTPSVKCDSYDSPSSGVQLFLPTIATCHSDLTCITGDVVKDLLDGRYSHTIPNYHIIDCRYPYEYEAGHIKDALNLYTAQMVRQMFFGSGPDKENSKSTVIIFHCEYSSKRGPRLYRLMRNIDRQLNAASYPHLHYPQMYILEGGYCSFFSSHKEYCDPMAYTPMVHKDYKDDLRKFKVKSKSWPQPADRVGSCKVALRF